MQACASERDVFCSEIQTGQARVFRCLVHNLGKADFGETCKKEVMTKLSRRQQNWKLDVTLRKACKEDAATVCKEVDHDADHAEVTRCLMKNHANVTEPCQHEVCCCGFHFLFRLLLKPCLCVLGCPNSLKAHSKAFRLPTKRFVVSICVSLGSSYVFVSLY